MITELQDRHGKPIYTGDIVMKRLGKFGKKSGGPAYYMIVKHKRSVAPAPTSIAWQHLRIQIRATDMQYITIVDTQYREE